jgi:peptidoglycan/xylan/chitin deacetylase (PgdA/CDA1 family)
MSKPGTSSLVALDHHGRYDFVPIDARPQFRWPGDKPLAFYVALNVERFSFGKGLGHTPTSLGPPPDTRNFGWRDYGLRVGIWRIFDLFDKLGWPLCHLFNASICESIPQIVERIRHRNDEVVGHGFSNSERQSDMDEATEAAMITRATELLTKAFGKRPTGWMGPWIAETLTTPDLLKEAGYSYVMDWPADDQPFWMKTRAGPLLSVPYPTEINDSPTMLSRAQSATDFTQMIRDQFEEMLELSEKQSLVCGISLHTFVVGQPFRLRQLRQALDFIRNHPKIDRLWITTPGRICEYAASLPQGTIV